jgi:hypothetical protein
LGFRVWGSGCRVQGLGFRVWGSGFGVQGLQFAQIEILEKAAVSLEWLTGKGQQKKEAHHF